MVSLYRDPLGEDIFRDHLQTVNVSRDGALIITNKDDKLLELQARVKQLENLLEESRVSSCSVRQVRNIMDSLDRFCVLHAEFMQQLPSAEVSNILNQYGCGYTSERI